MDPILKFKEAAKEFQNDERYLRLEAARKANEENADLQEKMREFSTVRLELGNMMNDANKDDAKAQELNAKLEGLYSDIMADESMIAYNEAKQEVEGFIEYINAVLNAAIEGSDPMLVDEPQSCSGGCSSCGSGEGCGGSCC